MFRSSLMYVPVRRNLTGHGGEPDQIGTFGHDALARFDTGGELYILSLPVAERDRPARKRFARELDKHDGPARIIDDSRFAYSRSGRACRCEKPDLHGLT